jgi:hypothetical protein
MTTSRHDLEAEAHEALDRIWFIQRLEVTARTALTFAVRLYIRDDLFVQAFLGERSDTCYLALIEGHQRIYGLDREGGAWHRHPYDAPDHHEMLSEAPGPRPLFVFLAHVEELLMKHALL